MTTCLGMLTCLAFTLIMFINSCELACGHKYWEDNNHGRSKINHLCSKSSDATLCLELLTKSDHDYDDDSFRDIAQVVIDLGISKAKWIYEKLNSLAKAKRRNWEMKDRYYSCSKNFEDSIRDLKLVKKYFSEHDNNKIESHIELNDVLQEESDCVASLRRATHSVSDQLLEKIGEFEFVVKVIKIAMRLAHKD